MGSADVAVGGGGEGGGGGKDSGGGDEIVSAEAYTACLKLEPMPGPNQDMSMEMHNL